MTTHSCRANAWLCATSMILQILNTIAGASAFLGLLGVIGYLYIMLRERQLKKSIREVVEGDPLFNAQQIVAILEQFKTDENKLQALQNLTHHDSQKARDLLDRFSQGSRLEDLSRFAKKETKKSALGGAGLILILLALIAAVATRLPSLAPRDTDKKDHKVLSSCTVAPPEDQASADGVSSALESHQFPYALTLAETYVRDFPHDSTAYRLKGIAHYKLEQYDSAIAAYDKALGICPDDLRVLFNKAAALSELGEFEGAKTIYKKLLEGNEQDLETRLSLAFVQLREGKLEDAWTNYHRVSAHQNGKPLLASANLGMGMARLLKTNLSQSNIQDGVQYLMAAICTDSRMEDVLLGRVTDIDSLSFRGFRPLLKVVGAKKLVEYEDLMTRIRNRSYSCPSV